MQHIYNLFQVLIKSFLSDFLRVEYIDTALITIPYILDLQSNTTNRS